MNGTGAGRSLKRREGKLLARGRVVLPEKRRPGQSVLRAVRSAAQHRRCGWLATRLNRLARRPLRRRPARAIAEGSRRLRRCRPPARAIDRAPRGRSLCDGSERRGRRRSASPSAQESTARRAATRSRRSTRDYLLSEIGSSGSPHGRATCTGDLAEGHSRDR